MSAAEIRAEFATYVDRAIREELSRIEEYDLGRPGQGFWIADEGGLVGTVGVERQSDESSGYRRVRTQVAHAASHKTPGAGLSRFRFEKPL